MFALSCSLTESVQRFPLRSRRVLDMLSRYLRTAILHDTFHTLRTRRWTARVTPCSSFLLSVAQTRQHQFRVDFSTCWCLFRDTFAGNIGDVSGDGTMRWRSFRFRSSSNSEPHRYIIFFPSCWSCIYACVIPKVKDHVNKFGHLSRHGSQSELPNCVRVHGFRAAIVSTLSGYEALFLL